MANIHVRLATIFCVRKNIKRTIAYELNIEKSCLDYYTLRPGIRRTYVRLSVIVINERCHIVSPAHLT